MFKRILFPTVTVFILFSAVIFAQSPDAMFARGNAFYQAKNYDKAIEAYENLVEMGYQAPELLYNLGNAYYKVGKLGYAILYYEKALKLSPSDEDIQHNLAFVNIQTVDKIETMPKFFVFQWWESLLALFSLSGWTWTAFVFYILMLIAIVLYFFARGPVMQKYTVYGGFLSVFLLAVSITILGLNLHRENNVKRGVIVEHTVTAKLSPDDRSTDAFVIHEGLKVNIEDRVSNWLKIRLQDGKIGWLQQENIKII